MAEYRIYLLRKSAIRGRHDFEAASDQHATQIAHVLLDTCSDDCDFFDLWSGTRHVAVPRLFVPKTFDELSEVLQERTLEIEEQIASGEWLTGRSIRLLETLESKKIAAACRHLAQAEGHVIQGSEHVARQHEIVADLKARGRDTTLAEELLNRLEQTQAASVAHRDRLRRELGATDTGDASPLVTRAVTEAESGLTPTLAATARGDGRIVPPSVIQISNNKPDG